MFYIVTFRMNEGLDRSIFTTEKILADAISFLNILNFERPLRLRNENSVYQFSFRLRRLIGESFQVLSYFPLSEHPGSLQRGLLHILQQSRFAREYYISLIEVIDNAESAERGVPFQTQNQKLIDQLAGLDHDSIPERYFCALTEQMMDLPVQLPGGQVVDWEAFAKANAQSSVDPFTNVAITHDQVINLYGLQGEIYAYIQVELFSVDLVERINEVITPIDFRLHSAFMKGEGNPYGYESQRYALAQTTSTIHRTVPGLDAAQRLVDRYREEVEFYPVSYPHPDHTIRALKDAYHSLMSGDLENFSRIANYYPGEARKFFFNFANRIKPGQRFHEIELMQRPYTQFGSCFFESHRERINQRLRLPLEDGPAAAAPPSPGV